MTPTISVVIPVLDEERRIRRCLEAARALPGIAEILVVDGGSRDRTREIAREVDALGVGAPGVSAIGGVRGAGTVKILDSARGRAKQMNAGAAVASGDVILFL